MVKQKPDFGALFKKYRLRSSLTTLKEFADSLAKKGFAFDKSLFSHWQKNIRIPKNRKLILAIIQMLIEEGGISSLKDINAFLESADQGYLTDEEFTQVAGHSKFSTRLASADKTLQFLIEVNRSKRLVRTGWTEMKINDPESVAEHSFQLSIMAIFLADQLGVNKERLVKMAVIHDLGELITGDIVCSRGKIIDIEKRYQKERLEMEGILKIFGIINKSNEFKSIYEDMLERKTEEAKIFWQLDKLEMAIQALVYEKESNKDLEEFFVTTDLHLQDPFLRKILAAARRNRPNIKNKR
ncbi:HD domain-containing protein [Candidatus Roizmanbacteria bacterium]|jgi:putative hydrolase of HD superfamily|nr:HD domain-containing protein [Candidatus Roizmanbacteria bacterium]